MYEVLVDEVSITFEPWNVPNRARHVSKDDLVQKKTSWRVENGVLFKSHGRHFNAVESGNFGRFSFNVHGKKSISSNKKAFSESFFVLKAYQ